MPIRVLLADESPATARAIQSALPEPEFDVRAAVDGARAARALAEFKPDAVLASLGLPGRSGYEIGAMLREDPAARVVALVFLQGVTETLDVNRLSGLDHDGVVRKPFDSTALAGLVRRAVEKRREIPSLPEEPQVEIPREATPSDPASPTLGLEDTPLEKTLRRLVRDEIARAPWEEKMREIAAAEYRKRLVRELRRPDSPKK
ncbi:MAG: response regulator [Candidatus Aminicenantes bacterium]|nr:response regulator [Candidatus Aminicenantes bacterium]